MSYILGSERGQVSLLPPCVEDYVAPEAMVRIVDAFVASLNLGELGFGRAIAARPADRASTPATCCVSTSGAISTKCARRAILSEPACRILKRFG